MSNTIKRNLTKLVYVHKEKNPKLKIFISLLFQGEKKTVVFDFKRKSVFWDLRYSSSDKFLFLSPLLPYSI